MIGKHDDIDRQKMFVKSIGNKRRHMQSCIGFTVNLITNKATKEHHSPRFHPVSLQKVVAGK